MAPDTDHTQVAIFVLGLLLAVGACFVSRYAIPDWTGAIAGVLVTAGVITSFVAGLMSRD